jgi:hypothetical protein
LLRAWLAFSALAIIGASTFLIIDRDDPLRSDDPYLAGIFLGIVAACATAVYSVAEKIGQHFGREGLRDRVYVGALTAWCLFWWLCSFAGGNGIGAIYSAVSLGSGSLTWPLCRFALPGTVVAAISCGGALLLAMYCVVAVRMALR